MKKLIFYGFVFVLFSFGCTEKTEEPITYQIPKNPEIYDHQIMVLGSFHFNHASDASDVVGKHVLDVMTEENQLALAGMAEYIIQQFDPTIVAIELRPKDQNRLDSLYQRYLQEEWSLARNEVFQLGFRIAKLANLEGVYCVDNRPIQPRSVVALDDWETYADSIGHRKLWEEYEASNAAYNNYLDSLKTVLDLRSYLIMANSEENKKRSKELWFTGLVNLGHGDTFIGADLTGYWYQRNARIFANVRNLTKTKQERILLIYGYGHKWILDEMFEGSPEFRLIPAGSILNQVNE